MPALSYHSSSERQQTLGKEKKGVKASGQKSKTGGGLGKMRRALLALLIRSVACVGKGVWSLCWSAVC